MSLPSVYPDFIECAEPIWKPAARAIGWVGIVPDDSTLSYKHTGKGLNNLKVVILISQRGMGQDRNCHQKSRLVKLLVIVIIVFKQYPSTYCFNAR